MTTFDWQSSLATEAMHFSQAWRDGYNDAVRGFPCHSTKYEGDSSLLYFDGWNVGSVLFAQRAVDWHRNRHVS